MKYLLCLFLSISFLACCNEKTSDLQAELIQENLHSGVSNLSSILHDYLIHFNNSTYQSGNPTELVKRLEKAEKLTKRVKSLVSFIDNLEKEIDRKIKASPQNQSFAIGESMLGEAQKLKSELDLFVNFLYREYKYLGTIKKKDFPYLMTNQNYTKNHFKNYKSIDIKNFFQDLKYKILTYQKSIFKSMVNDGERFGAEDKFIWDTNGKGNFKLKNKYRWRFNFAQSNSNKNTFSLNQDYEGQLFYNYPNSFGHQIKEVWINGKRIQSFGDDDIYIEINPNKTGQFTWKAKVNMQLDYLNDTTFYITKKYKVIQ